MLRLPIKGQWFDGIDQNIKLEDYREIKAYWTKRFISAGLLNPDGTPSGKMEELTFRNGYGKNAPEILARVLLSVGTGRPEWGAPPGETLYRLEILRKVRIR